MSLSFSPEIIKKLSPLEQDIINLLKEDKEYSTADVYHLLLKKRKVAQSSISVLLDRLHKKGLLQRRAETARGGIRFLYQRETNQEQYERKVVELTVDALIKKFGKKAVAYFNESF